MRGSKVIGDPDPRYISTSIIERQNLNIRMCLRRFTRLSNGFSKKLDNHKFALALYNMCYNFVKIHGTLRVPPTMEAGVSDHVWTYEEVVGLLG